MKWVLFSFAVALLFAGCPEPKLPPGLPPPEYEAPQVTPWPPADAATEADSAGPSAADGGVPDAAPGPAPPPPDASVGGPASTR